MERCFQLPMFYVYIFPAKVLHWIIVAREDFSAENFTFFMFLSCSWQWSKCHLEKKKNHRSRFEVTLNQMFKWKWAHQKCIILAAVLFPDPVKSTLYACLRIGTGLLPSSDTPSQNRGSCYQMVKQTHRPAAHNSNPLSTQLSACLSLVDQLSNLWRVQTKGDMKDVG